MSKPVVVIGDGWAALAAVSLSLEQAQSQAQAQGAKSPKTKVIWISGSGARMMPPLPTLEIGQDLEGAQIWQKILHGMGIDSGEWQSGSFLREFRNKSFREPVWVKAPTLEARASVIQEELWAPEMRLVPLLEGRFPLTLHELEGALREKLTSEKAAQDFPGLKRIHEVPVSGFRMQEGKVAAVILGSGEEIECERVIYADRWKTIPELQGLPKGLSFLRKREPMSVLQTAFTHKAPMGVGLMEGFFGPLHKEAGEEAEKHLWGYFSSDGLRSYWTLCLTGEEVEDNHAIAKKLRRMKSALDKMFAGESWLPSGTPDFMANVSDEQVRFEEAVLFAEGEILKEPIRLPKIEGLVFMTDGYGFSSAMHQIGSEFGLMSQEGAQEGLHAQTESVDLAAAPHSESLI